MSQPSNNKNAARGIFHYTTEGMAVPPNVRKVEVDSSTLQRLPQGAFSEQARMYQLDFVSSLSSGDNDRNLLFEIGGYALYKCRILAAFHPPPTVTVIGPKALWGCVSLMNVTLPNQLKAVQHGTFALCKLLESIRIPGSVEVIGSEAFLDCNSLTNIIFEEGRLRTIEDRALAGCGFLASVSIPSTLETIGNRVFEQCRCLRQANLAPPHGRLKTIGSEAFASLERLEKVTIPDGLETIGDGAFRRCVQLNDVVVLSPFVQAADTNNETRIRLAQMPVGLSASARAVLSRLGHYRPFSPLYNYYHCRSAVGLELGGSSRLVSLGTGCFHGCISLSSLSLPPTIESLSRSAFTNAWKLMHVQLSEGLRVIQAGAFCACWFLRAIKIPSTVTVIEDEAFALCVSLVSVKIPRNLQSLGNAAFSTCDSLLNIWLPPQLASSLADIQHRGVFSGCPQLISKYGVDHSRIVQGLVNRFQGRPIHELCYHDDNGQAAATTLDEELHRSIIAASSDDYPLLLVDQLGMTPCHILASSTNVRMDLFQALMDAYPNTTIPSLCTMDHSGNYVLDYLYTNTSSNDEVVRLEQLVFEKTLNDRIRRLGNLSWRNQVEEACSAPTNDPSSQPRSPDGFHQKLHNAYMLLERYERLEMALLLEILLWRMALKNTGDAPLATTAEHREHCRVISGAGAVIKSVMPFLIEPP